TMAMGFGMAQEMMRSMQPGAGGAAPAAGDAFSPAAAQAAQAAQSAVPATGGPQVLTPEQAAQALSVDLSDVMAAIEAGDLRAREFGSAWRISQSALDEFLRG